MFAPMGRALALSSACVSCNLSELNVQMVEKVPVFDDPTYMTSNELSDGNYDPPPSFLDRVPQRNQNETNTCPAAQPELVDDMKQSSTEHPTAAEDPSKLIEDSGAYTIIKDFLPEDGQAAGGQTWGALYEEGEGEEEDYEDEEGEWEEGKGRRVKRKVTVRQSYTHREKEAGESDRIYVSGNIVPPQPMLSFKSRVRARSREELEQEGIYQGLVITDDQKQQLGIMPESIYMTVALETCQDELDHMSMEMQPKDTKPVVQQPMPSVTPKYRGCILYPPPLPPLNQGAPTTQRKCHAIVENLLKSEAAFLTSLKVAEQIYLKPLQQMSSPPIDKEQVRILFGPLAEVMTHHELFYTALTTRTMDWGPKQTIGNVFMIFYRKEVIGHYVEYVNNFTDAMGTLQKSIKKRPKFVNFLKERYRESKTSLSLQGLLLKPIQRFPQYILFLQDLIKYTPPHHADRVALQIALARCETIAEHLNEAKRNKEQQTIVSHLSGRVADLPFKLTDSPNRCLQTQEAVTRLMLSPQGSDNLVEHKRSLLLFNNMVMCAAMSKKSTTSALHDVGPYDDARYKCKWFCPLDKLNVTEPDYSNDIWDYVMRQDESEEAVIYDRVKSQYLRHIDDLIAMGKIASLVFSLADTYPGLTVASIQNHLRVLQRKIARAKEQLRRQQPGRLDIQIPSRDGSKIIHHTYVFDSEKAKQNWLKNLRYATLKLKEENQTAWVYAENAEDDDIVLDSTRQLPLFVEHYHLTNSSEALSTECATKVLANQVWFVSCSSATAEIAIVQCVTPEPILLKSFTVDSTRILAICYVPSEESSHQSTPRQSSTSSIFTSPLSTLSDTVWIGSQTGKLMIHPASSEVAHKCIEVINFSDTITCMEYYRSQVFIAVEGNLYIYKRPQESDWDLDNPVVMKVHSDGPITCMCQVQQKLWIGAGNLCYILNMNSRKIEGHFQLNRNAATTVRKMTSSGSGVWTSYRRSAAVQLFHTVTKSLLQEIDIEKAFLRIVSKHNLQSKTHSINNLHVTSLLLCQGYLWVGTSAGLAMVYRTPYLKTVPIVIGKPYMATYGHSSAVRVLISTHTVGTLSSSRLNQFISEEQERFQEDTTEFCDENHVPQSPTTNDTTSVNGGEVIGRRSSSSIPASIPEEGTSASSTFPPLPPPIFSDEVSPTGTLKTNDTQDKLTTLASEDVPDSAHRENGSSTLRGNESQPFTNSTIESTTATVQTATNAPQYTSDGMSLPVRRKSSKTKSVTKAESRESEVKREGTFRRILTPESLDPGRFRCVPTPDAAKNGRILQSPDENEGTFRRKPTPECHPALYDEVAADESPTLNRNKSPSPYEDPATLDLTGPIPLRPMPDFFTTLDQSAVPGYGAGPVEGAIYVLTGGRGLVNLRPGKRRSVHYIALSGSDVSTADKSCIVAYELK